MEVGSIALVAPPEPAARPAPETKRETGDLKPVADTAAMETAVRDIAARQTPDMRQREVRLDVDQNSGRVVGTIFDKESGELIAQIPSKEILALLEKTRAMLGPLVDQKA